MLNLILIGNTGVGKSSILNLFISDEHKKFNADFSLINGLTTKTTYVEVLIKDKIVRLIDCPGLIELSDEKVNNNAQELTKALKFEGEYKLIFIYQSNGGRILPQDVFTTKKVCKSINYCLDIGLIINKVNTKDNHYYENYENKQKIVNELSEHTGNKLTIDRITTLEYCADEEEMYKLKPKVEEYIENMIPAIIPIVVAIETTVHEIQEFLNDFQKAIKLVEDIITLPFKLIRSFF